MRTIAIALIGILIALFLVVYRPWRTNGHVLNVPQDNNRPVTGASDVNQPAKDVQQPVKKEVKQRVTDAQGAKRHGKGARRSMTGWRQDVKRGGSDFKLRVVKKRVDYGANVCAQLRCEGREFQVVETPAAEQVTAEQVTIDVRRPTGGVKAVSVEVQEQTVAPMDVEYVEGSSVWAPAREIYLAAPERQECPTPQAVWVELSVR
ncbi:MAG TPA: hypothetical protein VFS27_06940 [Blastocatellia bacterium]|jgi:hypothetical protein|nr:hypothetical protein [Blastocatellia bacterium]